MVYLYFFKSKQWSKMNREILQKRDASKRPISKTNKNTIATFGPSKNSPFDESEILYWICAYNNYLTLHVMPEPGHSIPDEDS